MEPDDHLRITLAVVQNMVQCGANLPQEFLAGLEDGILDPFNETPLDPLGHHDYSKNAIRKYVARARECNRKGELYSAGYNAGRAIHYLQDRSFGGLVLHLGGRHYKKELEFSFEPIADPQIHDGLVDSTNDWSRVDWVIDNAEMSYTLEGIMKKACYVTAFVLNSVLTPDPPENVSKRKRRLAKLRLVATVALGAVATTLVAWFYPIHGYKVLGLLFAWLPARAAYVNYSCVRRWYSKR
ncbi:phospholipase C/P1 nuclease family protein [Archaeoglobus neptunius]|uniref:hypothetical protein n=1 Tax=Archaeoglobus neptunius TaxID=2798580 RepID=UPI0019258A23|nr:hypothetical protein [Archaeoglobus neptunius]